MDATELSLAAGFARRVCEGFAKVKDPRVVGRCDHLLMDILSITILAVLCGADDWPEVEEFGKRRESWLKEFLELPSGIPSHDTFQRVFEALDRKQFAECLFGFTQAMHAATGGTLVAIDGKTLRASGRKKTGLANLHLVTAWATESGLTLGQVACEDKSNEITAIPQLLRLLELKDCTVTIDAMGCQTAIAEQIRRRKATIFSVSRGISRGFRRRCRNWLRRQSTMISRVLRKRKSPAATTVTGGRSIGLAWPWAFRKTTRNAPAGRISAVSSL